MSPPYHDQLAEWTEFVPESEIRRGSLPIDTFKRILYQIADELEIDGIDVLNYGPTSGIASLKKTLAERIKRVDGVNLPRDLNRFPTNALWTFRRAITTERCDNYVTSFLSRICCTSY
ncbi:MAG: hypothetical protein ACXACU_17280 [Candidatus Hodarchaeales archaeon]